MARNKILAGQFCRVFAHLSARPAWPVLGRDVEKKTSAVYPEHHRSIRQRSFTLIELVIVLVIIGIIVAVVLPRFDVFYAVKFRTAVKRVVQDIRYVQNVAMTQHVKTRMIFNPVGDTYEGEYYDTTSSLWVDLKDSFQNPLRIDYTTDIQYGGIDLSNANFGGATPEILIFTFAGIPQDSDENDITTAGFVSLDYRDYPQEVINVTPKTGKVVLP